MNRINEIRARLDAATPGPWEWGGGNIIYTPQPIEVSEANWGGKGLNSYRLATAGDEGAWRDEDAALIAHAPADLRDLLAVADAARWHAKECRKESQKALVAALARLDTAEVSA